MKKVSKEVAAPMALAAWNATKGLPEAPAGMAESAVFYHAGNPAPPMLGADPMDGHAGSISAAFNAIVLHCAGYRVPVTRIKAILAAHMFHTSKGVQPGCYNPNHTSDLACLKPQNGFMTISASGGTVAVNPDWLLARSATVAPAVVVVPTEAPAVVVETMLEATGLDKAAGASFKAGKSKRGGKAKA